MEYGEKKYNHELYKSFEEPNIVQSIKINRLKWLGHIRRMDESLLCRKLTFSQLEGSRKKGRQTLRWLDEQLQDDGRRHKTEIVGRVLSRRSRLTKNCSAR
jgi:hypothetical protein